MNNLAALGWGALAKAEMQQLPQTFRARYNQKIERTEADIDLWVKRHDDVISARLDRKGLIHTTSYSRAKLLRERSKGWRAGR